MTATGQLVNCVADIAVPTDLYAHALLLEATARQHSSACMLPQSCKMQTQSQSCIDNVL